MDKISLSLDIQLRQGGRMNMQSTKQYLMELQKEYLEASKKEKSLLLNEAHKRTGQNRKYLTDRLSVKTNWCKVRKKTVRKECYSADLIAPLVKLWDIFDRPCGQRLKSLIETELERLRILEEIVVFDIQADHLKTMSAKTIDTLLTHEKEVRHLKKQYRAKTQSLLYRQIPTKMSREWDRKLIGQIQIDGVEHCGQSAQGEYLNTISTTDISSHWWEGEAVMGKGQRYTLQAMRKCQQRFPFDWQEIHPDNGTSFINYFIYDYANQSGLEFSRSRPYQKNDNCFVEQKNSQNVRRHVGYVRYDTKRELDILNDLYRNELCLYKNFFQPVMRLEVKIRDKGHIYRKYQKAKTPYQWLMESAETPIVVKQELEKIYRQLNPAQLKRNIDSKLEILTVTYSAKHTTKEQKQTTTTVRFLNYPTGRVGLGCLTT